MSRLTGKECEDSIVGERRALSTEELVRVAAAIFVQTSALVPGDLPKVSLPFGLSLSSLNGDQFINIELVTLLLTAAEEVNNEQYERARILLSQCDMSASKYGNPVQRVIHYFSNALKERVNRETENLSSKRRKEEGALTPRDVIKAVRSSHPVQLVSNATLPFNQVLHSTAMQTLLDNVASARRIHMIDFSVKYGQQWTLFLHALSTRKFAVESITISAIAEAEELIIPTGKRLSSFAQNLHLPFKFRPVIVKDMKELNESMFEVEEGETVGIYTSHDMNSLIVKPQSLENLMRVMQNLNPCMVTVIDVEANQNSTSFICRFTETLFFYSAYFDCLDSLVQNDEDRLMIEGGFFAKGIKNVLADEGSDRVMRYVGVSVWRAYFRRFGLREAKLCGWSVYQASLVIKQFVEDDSCTLERNGSSLLVGWKGTPLHFVSAWKFSTEGEVL